MHTLNQHSFRGTLSGYALGSNLIARFPSTTIMCPTVFVQNLPYLVNSGKALVLRPKFTTYNLY